MTTIRKPPTTEADATAMRSRATRQQVRSIQSLKAQKYLRCVSQWAKKRVFLHTPPHRATTSPSLEVVWFLETRRKKRRDWLAPKQRRNQTWPGGSACVRYMKTRLDHHVVNLKLSGKGHPKHPVLRIIFTSRTKVTNTKRTKNLVEILFPNPNLHMINMSVFLC